MIIRNLTQDGDWTFGSGLQNFAKGEQAVAVNLKTRLLSWSQDCFFSPTFGMPWANILGQKSTDIIVLSLSQFIAQSYGITQVTNVLFRLDSKRTAHVTYFVNTIYSRQLTGTVVV
jgi:hypothetical protein